MRSGIQFTDFPSTSNSNGRGAFHTGVAFTDPQTTYGEQGFTAVNEDMSDTPIYQKDRGAFHTGVQGI